MFSQNDITCLPTQARRIVALTQTKARQLLQLIRFVSGCVVRALVTIKLKAVGVMSQKIILVDTDPGIDDCAALMMLLSQPRDVKVVGLTCVAGNVGIQHVTINAVRIVKLFDKLDEVL